MPQNERRLGNRLKEHRARTGLTQGDLAEAAQVSRKTINTVENGVFVPSTELAFKLARALGTSVEALFYLPGEEAGRPPRTPG